MKRIYLARDIQDAYIMKGALENEGIEAIIKNETLGAFVGEIPLSEAYPEVWVEDADADKAEQIIRTVHDLLT